jgi:hypothetical protein
MKFLLLLLLCIGVTAVAEQPKPPTLQIHVGQSLFQITRNQPVQINLEQLLDQSPVLIDEVFIFNYDEAGLAFTLPPTRYIWLSQLAGVVHSIKTAPHLRYLALPEAWDLGRAITSQIETGTQWQLVDRTSSSLADVQAMAAGSESKDEFRVWMGEWQQQSVTLELSLQRQVRAGRDRGEKGAPGHDLYLVNLLISDGDLERKLLDQVIDKRLAIAGDPTEALPLTVWLEEQR